MSYPIIPVPEPAQRLWQRKKEPGHRTAGQVIVTSIRHDLTTVGFRTCPPLGGSSLPMHELLEEYECVGIGAINDRCKVAIPVTVRPLTEAEQKACINFPVHYGWELKRDRSKLLVATGIQADFSEVFYWNSQNSQESIPIRKLLRDYRYVGDLDTVDGLFRLHWDPPRFPTSTIIPPADILTQPA